MQWFRGEHSHENNLDINKGIILTHTLGKIQNFLKDCNVCVNKSIFCK